jgi:hypothetical protein
MSSTTTAVAPTHMMLGPGVPDPPAATGHCVPAASRARSTTPRHAGHVESLSASHAPGTLGPGCDCPRQRSRRKNAYDLPLTDCRTYLLNSPTPIRNSPFSVEGDATASHSLAAPATVEWLARSAAFALEEIRRLFESNSPRLPDNPYALGVPLNTLRALRSDWRDVSSLLRRERLAAPPRLARGGHSSKKRTADPTVDRSQRSSAIWRTFQPKNCDTATTDRAAALRPARARRGDPGALDARGPRAAQLAIW